MDIFSCNFCNEEYSSRTNLQDHYYKIHSDRSYKCTKCGECFWSNETFAGHKATHRLASKPFVCRGRLNLPGQTCGCGETFAGIDLLLEHYQSLDHLDCLLPSIAERLGPGRSPVLPSNELKLSPGQSCLTHAVLGSHGSILIWLQFSITFIVVLEVMEDGSWSSMSCHWNMMLTYPVTIPIGCTFYSHLPLSSALPVPAPRRSSLSGSLTPRIENSPSERDRSRAPIEQMVAPPRPMRLGTMHQKHDVTADASVQSVQHQSQEQQQDSSETESTSGSDEEIQIGTTSQCHNRAAPARKHPATFRCKLCPKSYTRASALRAHYNNHEGKRPYACTLCQRTFTRRHDQKTHEKAHTGERQFVCSGSQGCGQRFTRASNLARHLRSPAGKRCRRHRASESEKEDLVANEGETSQVAIGRDLEVSDQNLHAANKTQLRTKPTSAAPGSSRPVKPPQEKNKELSQRIQKLEQILVALSDEGLVRETPTPSWARNSRLGGQGILVERTKGLHERIKTLEASLVKAMASSSGGNGSSVHRGPSSGDGRSPSQEPAWELNAYPGVIM